MPRWLKITLRIFIGLTGLVVLLWLGLAIYINTHKQEILKEITRRLSEKTGGQLTIRDMKPSLWKSFPNVSLVLEDITLRDSLFEQHHHSLLEAQRLYVRLNTFELLSKRTEINKLTVSHGSIYLYTDSSGYSNTYLLSKKDTAAKKGAKETVFESFALEDIRLRFVHKIKQKLFDIHIRHLDGNTALASGAWQLHVRTKAHVHQFCFNTTRGSYLKDKDLDINMALTYDPQKKVLLIPDQELKISGEPILMGGSFDFGEQPARFAISLRSASIPYKTAVSWVSQNIASKLDSFDFKKPVAVDVQVNGVMQFRNIPTIKVAYIINDNTLSTKAGDVDHVSFQGFYFNEAKPGEGHGDENSQLQFQQVKGAWNNIPFTMDTLRITNLITPYVDAHVQSTFPLTTINGIISGNSFSFDKGTAEADFRYIGGVLAHDTTPYSINGYVRISDAGLTYQPRALTLDKVRATVLFRDDNVFLKDVHLSSTSSTVDMEGEALHFLRFYFTDPGKITLNWRIRSPQINLGDFLTFAGKRRQTTASQSRAQKGNTTRIGDQIDNVLNASSIQLDATVDKLIYKSFTANQVNAHATLSQSGIRIEKAGLQHAGGTISISGSINQSAVNNPFELQAGINKVNVATIFKSFDNFGQDAINSTNLEGLLTASAVVKGQMRESGQIIRNSMYGHVDFNLDDGALNNFSPLEKIGKFIFRKRNLSHVTFKSLHNRLLIEGNKIKIPPMKVETSAVNIDIAGVYGMPTGTDIYMSIPLRNPEKETASTIVGKLLRKGKGFVVNLRAQDGDSNGVKIGWDPFQKGKKAADNAPEKTVDE
jgi:hypothetical protein